MTTPDAGTEIVTINCGSTSLKAARLDPESGRRSRTVRVERIGAEVATVTVDDGEAREVGSIEAAGAVALALPPLLEAGPPAGVGHRVVHGGERFSTPARIDADVEAAIEALAPLAPLHNPPALAAIRAARSALPDVPQVAVFDTAFHATLPRRARTYALPHAIAERHGLRRYGFHGTSHAWVAGRAASHLEADVRDLRLVTCHLGGGASVTAVELGRSIETSMGLTPLEGLVMGTRSGDVDPGLLIELARREGLDLDGLERLLVHESGLAGLSGAGADLRDLEERAAAGDDRCRLAIHVFAHRVRKYVGAYAAVLGGVDAIVVTGGIGQNSASMRHHVLSRLDVLGARLDEDRNREARVDREHPVAEISSATSRTRLLVVATDEAHAIARETTKLVADLDRVATTATIPVAISARHVHLTEEAVEKLFGSGHELTPRTELAQPGQFACEERVTLVGPKRDLEGVRVIGPARSRCQVEISRTDEFHLGLDAPIRRSGDLDGTPGILLRGPAGELHIDEGVICAQRHIHMTPDDAERFGVEHKDVVEVALDTDGRDLVYGDVVVRVKPSYRLEMHLDTDEGNAAELGRGAEGVLVETEAAVRLRRRRPG